MFFNAGSYLIHTYMPTHVLGMWAALVSPVPCWDKEDCPFSPTWFHCFSVYCSHSGDDEGLGNKNLKCKLVVHLSIKVWMRRSYQIGKWAQGAFPVPIILQTNPLCKMNASHRCRWLDRNKSQCSSVQGIKWASRCPGEKTNQYWLNKGKQPPGVLMRLPFMSEYSEVLTAALTRLLLSWGFWEHIKYPGAFAVASDFSLACKQAIPLGVPRVLTTSLPWVV